MLSFTNELENPVVQKDILDLGEKISLFRDGKIPDDKFKSARLSRGIYGQRQPGVQMVRIKLPYGHTTLQQLEKICNISDEYATGNLHITTRQDIQIHFVSLDRTPELWTELSKDSLTIREACGNTVRNVTGSPTAGVDPKEPFDITPYAHATFQYFLRNPITANMARKFKIGFSASEEDTAFAYMHDIGFIPKVKIVDGEEVRGFKVFLGGGLGAQPYIADHVTDFMHEDLIIPFAESIVRVFDRHGERTKRHKARLKYLIQDIGKDGVLELAEKERLALKNKTYKINRESISQPVIPDKIFPTEVTNKLKYEQWLITNVFKQKQEGYRAVGLKVQNGDMKTPIARKLIALVREVAADEIRFTNSQGAMLRFVKEENLPYVFEKLDELGLANPGFESIADITSCPGTDTCNLGISNSTGITRELERVILEEYPDLIFNKDISIKISGCINACGQHNITPIGFHGSSMKIGKQIAPALQVLLGGGGTGDGHGRASDKVIKVPSKRGPQVLRTLLEDYFANAQEEELFNDYYLRQGKIYFYDLLNPLTNQETVTPDDFIDWEHEEQYKPAIGVGECAGVVFDLVEILVNEAEEKIDLAKESFAAGDYADGIYHAYTSFVQSAKALLITENGKTNTQSGIIKDFDERFIITGRIELPSSFEELVYQINQHEPTEEFASYYIQQAKLLKEKVAAYRESQLVETEQI